MTAFLPQWILKKVQKMSKGTVKVKWTPSEKEMSMIETQTIKIEMDPDDETKIWIWMIEDGEKTEGGSFDLSAFMDCVLQFYNYHY